MAPLSGFGNMIAIDMETTGLKPGNRQILEVAFVPFDESFAPLHLYISEPALGWDWDSVAFKMNAALVERIRSGAVPSVNSHTAYIMILDYLRRTSTTMGNAIHLCGKNAGTFDCQFLIALAETEENHPIGLADLFCHYRVFDIASVLFNPRIDLNLPPYKACFERVGLAFDGIPHTAIDDARNYVTLVKSYYHSLGEE